MLKTRLLASYPRRAVPALLILAGLLQVPELAWAQATQAQSGEALEEIVVSGSRIATTATAPTPVTAFSNEQLAASSSISIATSLMQLPALTFSQDSSKSSVGAYAGSFLNLRNLGVDRTLVLMDGVRLIPTSSTANGSTGAVDVSLIPQTLVSRVDVVTGGASAVYGSDAVAGVVNFVLDKKFEGFKAEAQIGDSQCNDNKNYLVAAAAGGTFADGRAHLEVSLEHAESDQVPVDDNNTAPCRNWSAHQDYLTANPNTSPGQTPYIIVPNVVNSAYPINGTINSGPLRGIGFTASGAATPFSYGTATYGPFSQGGDGYNAAPSTQIASGYNRTNFFTRGSYELTDNTTVYVEALLSSSGTSATRQTPFSDYYAPGGIPVAVDNAYLPASIQAGMIANGLSQITVGKIFPAFLDAYQTNTEMVTAGLDGTIFKDWKWNVFFSVSDEQGTETYNENADLPNFFAAIDAVNNPANGQIVCRSTLTNPNNGCVPFNVMGNTPLTAAQQAYVYPTTVFSNGAEQEFTEASISGKPFSTWAGPVDVAGGASYRRNTLWRTANPQNDEKNPFTGAPGGLAFANVGALSGRISLWEVFAETEIPLASDVIMAKNLDFNAAIRYSDYSTSGGLDTWKLGLIWSPFPGIRVRLSDSRDARAPNIVELNQPLSTSVAFIKDPERGGAPTSPIALVSGNPDLQPEIGHTYTAGIVVAPQWVPGLSFSVDYFNIDINGEIQSLSPQAIFNLCAEGLAAYCNAITRNAAGIPITVLQQELNLARATTTGEDIEVDYNRPVNLFGSTANISVRLLATFTGDNKFYVPGASPYEAAGQVGQLLPFNGVPHWMGLGYASYSQGPWQVQVQEHYMGGGVFDAYLPGSASQLGTSGQWTTDLTLRRTVGKAEFYGTITNLFNQDPPSIPANGIDQGSTNYFLYSIMGRAFAVGARVKF
jgi:iron complex outermembrane recepter protein